MCKTGLVLATAIGLLSTASAAPGPETMIYLACDDEFSVSGEVQFFAILKDSLFEVSEDGSLFNLCESVPTREATCELTENTLTSKIDWQRPSLGLVKIRHEVNRYTLKMRIETFVYSTEYTDFEGLQCDLVDEPRIQRKF